MVTLLAWPGALAIGLSLGLLGSGGSILTVPVLVYLVGQDEKLAIASSLAIVGIIAIVGSIPYIRRREIDWRNVWLFGIPGMMGTYFGAWSATYVSGLFQLTVFAIVMIAAAFLMLRPLDLENSTGRIRSRGHIAMDGLVVGAVTGFVGVGGGFLVVPALVLLGGLNMHRAVATSLIIIAMKSLVGFAKYASVLHANGVEIDVNIILLVTAFGIVGSFAGSAIAQRVSTEKLQQVFGIFLVVMGLYILSTSGINLINQGGTG